MATSSKVLTVTYGTFSCTLEGFDDPFTTLQMVAEYFRKLAAEDRYFGGVPQVPDADALKRIAEENTPGNIAAEIAENSVILRQTDEDEGAVDAEVEPVVETEAELQLDEAVAEVQEDDELEEALAHDDELVDRDHSALEPAIDIEADAEIDVEPDTRTEVETAQADLVAPELVEPELVEPELAQDHDEMIDADEEALAVGTEVEAEALESETESEAVTSEADEPETDEIDTVAPQTLAASSAAEPQAAESAESVISPLTFFRSRRHEEQAEEPAEEVTEDEATPDADVSDDDLTLNIAPFSHRETKALKSVEETLAAIRQNVERAETDAETDLEAKPDDAAEIDEYDSDEYDSDEYDDEAEVEVEDAQAGKVDTGVDTGADTGATEEIADEVDDQIGKIGGDIDGVQVSALSDPLVLTLDDQTETVEVEAGANDDPISSPEAELDREAETEIESPIQTFVAVDETDDNLAAEIETTEVETEKLELEVEVEINQIQAINAEGNTDSTTDSATDSAAISSLSDEQEADLDRELAEALSFEQGDDEETAETTVAEAATAPEVTDEIADELADEIAATLNEDMAEERDELREPETSDEYIAPPPDEAVDEEEQRRLERRARADALRNSVGYDDEDEALDRLLQTTQTKMDRPEQARRLNALEQLKAAVAATEAEKKLRDLGPDAEVDDDTTDLDTYREDLRRAQNKARLGGLTGTPQPAPTPLILVSEQRIDEQPAALGAEPQEPQREVAETHGNLALKPEPELENLDNEAGEIQGIPADAFSEATNFADFAERIGAFELQDLLEASAAYTSIVEGKSRFSRAQIMSKITKIDSNGAFTKEAGLRSFGRLLREGKILRVQDGQFAISKASRFSIASRFE